MALFENKGLTMILVTLKSFPDRNQQFPVLKISDLQEVLILCCKLASSRIEELSWKGLEIKKEE